MSKKRCLGRFATMDKGEPRGLFGLVHKAGEQPKEVDYSIMAVTDGEAPQGYGEIIIPQTAWAVFD